jgi:uncharacterized protein (TIGR02588 family)
MNNIGKEPRSLAEWITFGIASFILATIIGLVIYTWIENKHEPPILSVTNTQKIRENEGKFYVPFEITNSGGETAESVQIIAELEINGNVETGEQQFEFLSRNEKEEGAFVFNQDPRQGKLTIRVASYKLP